MIADSFAFGWNLALRPKKRKEGKKMPIVAAIAPTGLAAGVHNENHEAVETYVARVKASGISDWRAHGLSRRWCWLYSSRRCWLSGRLPPRKERA